MIEDGYTFWARQTINSDIFFYKSDKWFKIWFYIVSKVFHKDSKLFNRGEALITYEEIMKATKASKQQVKDCIHYLEKEHMIESKQTTRGKIRKVVNYGIYQDGKNYETTKRPPTRPLADHQQTPPYIEKNIKNERTTNKEFEEFLKHFNEKAGNRNYTSLPKRTEFFNLRRKRFSLEEILLATERMFARDFYKGNNDRSWSADPEFLLKNDEQIDKFKNLDVKQKKGDIIL